VNPGQRPRPVRRCWRCLHALTALDPQATDKIDRTERLLQRLS